MNEHFNKTTRNSKEFVATIDQRKDRLKRPK